MVVIACSSIKSDRQERKRQERGQKKLETKAFRKTKQIDRDAEREYKQHTIRERKNHRQKEKQGQG
jgi:hypothetical protein